MKSALGRLWQETPWGHLWAAAIIVMIGAFLGALVDGFGLGKAVIVGILCGPGFLALLTILGFILSFISPQSD
jgi:hypothetical protein